MGQGYPWKLFNLEHFPIYGIHSHPNHSVRAHANFYLVSGLNVDTDNVHNIAPFQFSLLVFQHFQFTIKYQTYSIFIFTLGEVQTILPFILTLKSKVNRTCSKWSHYQPLSHHSQQILVDLQRRLK